MALLETDRLGGQDPYSASKACSELVTQSFYKSFFEKNIQVATTRTGNMMAEVTGLKIDCCQIYSEPFRISKT